MQLNELFCLDCSLHIINILHLEFILYIKNIYFLASSFKLQVSKVVRKVFKLENFEIRITLAQVHCHKNFLSYRIQMNPDGLN